MSTLDLSFHEDSFRRYLIASAGAHLAVVLILTLKAAIFPQEAFEYQSAVQVDLVALPDKIEATPQVAEQPPKAKDEKKKEMPPPPTTKKMVEKQTKKEIDRDAVNLDSTKKKEQAALERLKRMNALEEIERQEQEEAKKKAIEKLKQIKGNVISNGSDIKGVAKLQHDNYISMIEKHIRQYWSLPEWLAKKKLSAQIRVRFDEGGNVVYREIAKSSGNPTFDDLVVQTIQKSSPVPPPPAKFVRILNVEGILLGFPE